MQNTVNLNLKKPDQNDFVNIGDINDNMDILDAEVAKKYVKPLAGIPSLDLDSATQAALKKAETALQTVTKSSVGLGNVDNTSDVNKPVSTAQQVALDKKANLASPILTGTPTAPTAAESTNTQQIATTAFVDRAVKTHQADELYQAAGGTATAVTLNINGPLVDGYPMTFIASANNNGSATKINGKPLYKPNTTTAPTLIAGKAYTVWYNQSSDCFFIKASAEGNATVAQVLAGVTFSNDIDNGLVGTMANRGIFNLALGATVPAGYYSGGTVPNGKRWASGTTTSLTSPSRISISGLGFIPSIFLCYFSENALSSIVFFQKLFVIPGPKSSVATTRNYSSGDSSGQVIPDSIVNNSLGNFEMKIQHSLWGVTSNLTVNWIAIE